MKGSEAEEAASRNDSRTLNRIVRELTGTQSNSSVSVKDKSGKTSITTEEQDLRWMEHFQETLNQLNPGTLYGFNIKEQAETQDVCVDDIKEDEVANPIEAMKNNKAAGMDEIAAEMLKHGGQIAVQIITKLINCCWKDEYVPQDLRWMIPPMVFHPEKIDFRHFV